MKPSAASSSGYSYLQFVERECAAVGDFLRAADRLGRSGKGGGNLIQGPQVPLGVGKPVLGEAIDGRAQARRGEHFVQGLAGRRVVMHISRGHQRQAGFFRQRHEPGELGRIIGPAEQFGEKVAAAGENVDEGREVILDFGWILDWSAMEGEY